MAVERRRGNPFGEAVPVRRDAAHASGAAPQQALRIGGFPRSRRRTPHGASLCTSRRCFPHASRTFTAGNDGYFARQAALELGASTRSRRVASPAAVTAQDDGSCGRCPHVLGGGHGAVAIIRRDRGADGDVEVRSDRADRRSAWRLDGLRGRYVVLRDGCDRAKPSAAVLCDVNLFCPTLREMVKVLLLRSIIEILVVVVDIWIWGGRVDQRNCGSHLPWSPDVGALLGCWRFGDALAISPSPQPAPLSHFPMLVYVADNSCRASPHAL